jgi:type IV pilus assembly protein PilA
MYLEFKPGVDGTGTEAMCKADAAAARLCRTKIGLRGGWIRIAGEVSNAGEGEGEWFFDEITDLVEPTERPPIAIPAYQDYTIRAQVSEGLNAAGQYKKAVAEAFVAHSNSFEGVNNAALRLPEAVTNPFVTSIKVINGAIVITYGSRAQAGLAGKSLVLIPGVTNTQDVVWVCGQAGTPAGVHVSIADYEKYTSVPPKWLPLACRAAGPSQKRDP